jgi:hypothetical protein
MAQRRGAVLLLVVTSCFDVVWGVDPFAVVALVVAVAAWLCETLS